MANSPEFELNRRRNKLANVYTNSCLYEELGFGLQALVDYAIKLEDAIREDDPSSPMVSDI